MEKNFTENTDYIISLNLEEKRHFDNNNNNNNETKKHGGQNIKKMFLTIKCFKSLCLKSHTKKACEIHEYYMRLEEILHETMEEESKELKMQLQNKDNLLSEIEKKTEEEKHVLKKKIENAIVSQFPINTECIYLGTIDNTNDSNETLIKFGQTNNLSVRIAEHRKTFNNFVLIHGFKVQNKVEIENLIKHDKEIKKQIRSIYINGKISKELITYDENFTIEKLIIRIKNIIQSKTYSIDNFNRLMERNEEIENENMKLKDKIKSINNKIEEKNVELENANVEINYLKEKLIEKEKLIDLYKNENNFVYQNTLLLPEDEYNSRFNKFIDECCTVSQDVEESSVNIECRFRIWNQTKPSKEIFHALKHYMDTRFKQKRVSGCHHGYSGIKLNEIEYKKIKSNSDVETFVFQQCKFSDCGKILNSTLLEEYQKWKLVVGKECSDNDMKELKEYLNACPYAIKAVVWTEEGNNEGYYGLSLKTHEVKHCKNSSTGKNVYKREKDTNILLSKWNSIADASLAEGISASKMSRSIKNKVIINDDYYYDTQ